LENLRRFDPKKSFKTWLYTIARNNAYDHLRKKKTTPFSYLKTRKGIAGLTISPTKKSCQMNF